MRLQPEADSFWARYAFYLADAVFLKIDLTFKNRTIYITFWVSGFSCKTKALGPPGPRFCVATVGPSWIVAVPSDGPHAFHFRQSLPFPEHGDNMSCPFAVHVPSWLLGPLELVIVEEDVGQAALILWQKTRCIWSVRLELKPQLWHFSVGVTWTGHFIFLRLFLYM